MLIIISKIKKRDSFVDMLMNSFIHLDRISLLVVIFCERQSAMFRLILPWFEKISTDQ